MTSRSVSEIASQAPRLRLAPRAVKTYGDLAADFAADYGLKPDPWQQLILDDWLAESKGRWASLTCGLSVPRQNGKNAALEVRELFGMVGRGEKILHTAHQVKTAQKHFRRLKHFFGKKVDDPGANFPELNALVTEIRNVNGQEAIILANGGSVEIVARSQGSGRGFTVDVLVCDEAQDMSDDDLEAVMPATSSAPLGNPQWIFTGTPPGPKANGEVFIRVRDEALAGKAKRLTWHEWSVEVRDGEEIDLDDRTLWHAVNPALVSGRLQMDVVEGERARFSADGFARERLGMWDKAVSKAVIDSVVWRNHGDAESQVLDPVAIALDVAPMNATASLAVAGERADGRKHVEVVKNQRGTAWVVDALVKLNENDPCIIALDPAGGAGALLPAIEAAGLEVHKVSAREMAQACVGFHQAFTEGDAVHIEQPILTAALGAASKRDLAGLFAWNRKDANTDITPLVSATLALWAFAHAAARPKQLVHSGEVWAL